MTSPFLGACLFILVRQADKLPAGLGTFTKLQLLAQNLMSLQPLNSKTHVLFLWPLPLLLLAFRDLSLMASQASF